MNLCLLPELKGLHTYSSSRNRVRMTCPAPTLDKIINFLLNLSLCHPWQPWINHDLRNFELMYLTHPEGGLKQVEKPYDGSIWQYSLFFLWFSCITSVLLHYMPPQVLSLAAQTHKHHIQPINELETTRREAVLNHVLFLLLTPCTFLYSFFVSQKSLHWLKFSHQLALLNLNPGLQHWRVLYLDRCIFGTFSCPVWTHI